MIMGARGKMAGKLLKSAPQIISAVPSRMELNPMVTMTMLMVGRPSMWRRMSRSTRKPSAAAAAMTPKKAGTAGRPASTIKV